MQKPVLLIFQNISKTSELLKTHTKSFKLYQVHLIYKQLAEFDDVFLT